MKETQKNAKKNYQTLMEKTIEEIEKKQEIQENAEKKPALFLHACCAPCSSYVLECLLQHFDITLFFFNPNIYPKQEHDRRLFELEKFISCFPPCKKQNLQCIAPVYSKEEYEKFLDIEHNRQLAFQKERGERCHLCYLFRLQKTRQEAQKRNFPFWCTTLSVSPYKDAVYINEIAETLDKQDSMTKFLPSDFKKKNGFLRSLQLSKEYGLYRQEYCGCIYSFSCWQNKNKS